ncbi:retrotransposon protein, putative, ty1-copia subclass [Tanacetum coccineum]
MLGSMTPELYRHFENSSPYEMLQELKSMFEKQAGVKRFDLIQTFHACKQEEGKSVSSYVLKMKGYVEQLEHLGKKIGELHALLIKYKKGLPKKAATPQVMAIQGGRIQKANKKSLKGKESATCILNMVPTKKVYGCEVLVKRNTLDKLQQRSVKCIFIEYPKKTMGYYFYFPFENKIIVARSSRTHRAPNHLCLNVEVEEHSLGDLYEPTNYKAAMLDSKSDKWLDAMNVAMQNMKGNQVWCLVDLSSNGKTVGSKCLFKKKTDMDGIVYTYKARLVAKGFTQTYGVVYEETFSPIADIRAIRILIAIVAFYNYESWQMDVKTAFLNGYLDEDMV